MMSVPAFCTVPRTRSPSCEFSVVMVPSSGETMVVLSSKSCALSTAALATFTWSLALSSCACATSRATLKPMKSESESSLRSDNSLLRLKSASAFSRFAVAVAFEARDDS